MKKENIPQISVIVPVYNTSKYLIKCLKSITTQSGVDLEIIIVNDCSTDNSLEIIKKIAAKDNRIVIINKETNEGLELARRSGISIAKGNYIYHVDSDDWLVPHTLHILLHEAIESNADIVSANFYRTLDGYGIIKQKRVFNIYKKESINKEDFITKYYKSFFGHNIINISMWGKLYKKSFLENLQINLLGISLGEDLNYNIQVFPEANKILFLPLFVYNYRFGGMTSTFNDMLMSGAVKMYNIKKEQIEIYNLHHLEPYIIIELKNFFRTYLENLVKFKKNSFENFHGEIKGYLNSKEFEDISRYFATLNENDEFVKAILKKDSSKLITLSQKKVESEIWIYRLKIIIAKLLPN
ncbi:glycosyltransferase family 2 protein [Chryseobacterium sp. MP_3.2]|uniref:glycosyltransferase family 2 protein n=1 Tax=Chryseobacterium sp. MP_3.2 TaxID=3071712 RepID=UPI002E059A04|nr:glycosyltransferase involved in cell wall biosynthesis [Chryseobacterium sp. MP_3.2]